MFVSHPVSGYPVLTVPGRLVLSAHQENGAISPGTLCCIC